VTRAYDARVTELLGHVVAPSGTVVIIDCGFLAMWSHDAPPVMPDGVVDPETVEKARTAVDLRLTGDGAEEVGRAIDRQWHPLFFYDVPSDGVRELRQRVAAIAGERGVTAHVEVLPARVSHRMRIEDALAFGSGAGQFPVHGVWAIAIDGVPPGRHEVLGEVMPDGDPDAGRLRRVVVRFASRPVVRTELIGHVMVDWARLLVADADALGAWQHEEPLDGLADVVFWGRDAEALAAATGAPALGDQHGWTDLPIADAAARHQQLVDTREARQLMVAIDARPHSHHHVLMQQVRERPTESGNVAIAGAELCGFATRWGDGVFEVHRGLDANGGLVDVRIELGTPERQELMRSLEQRSAAALVSRLIIDGDEPVRFLCRQEPDNQRDSGWRLFSGVEPDGYLDDPDNIRIVELSELIAMDRRLEPLLTAPTGSAFECEPGAEAFSPVTDWQLDDD
jgi:hypothetical protein